MERDKRRSKVCEEELDRKIALIREKNMKIEQRSKEIEADRVNSTDETSKTLEIRQFSKGDPKLQKGLSSKGEWSREWDHGKTPVEMWRENVPSIENVDRLLRRGHTTDNRGRSTKHRNVRSGASREFNNDQTSGTSLRALNAAHDRMLIRTSDTKRFNRGRKKGEQGGQSKGKESVNLKNKQLGNTGYTEQVNSTGHHHKTIERQTFKGNGGNGGKDNTTIRGHINEVSKRNRRGDKYIIGTMLRKLVDRVVRMEKQEKKFQQRQTNNKDILKMESADVHPSKDVGKIASTLGSEAENLKDTQILKISNTKTNRDKEILMELSKSLLKEEKTEEEFMNNSEHNVIKLVEEKVLSMHLSPV